MKTTEQKLPAVTLGDCTQAFAIPGALSIVDCINPHTGRSWINKESLDEIRLRYPGAEIVSLAEWSKEKAALQDRPVEWSETTEEQYFEQLEVLPPACMHGGGFLVGEPADHHAVTGQPRFAAYLRRGKRCLTASRAMTRDEFQTACTNLHAIFAAVNPKQN